MICSETLTSAFNPLPAIAPQPLALIWFGLGDFRSFRAGALGAVGRRAEYAFGLPVRVQHPAHGRAQLRSQAGHALLSRSLIPAAFSLHPGRGSRSVWAFAWRTLIAAELVFGVSWQRRAWLVYL